MLAPLTFSQSALEDLLVDDPADRRINPRIDVELEAEVIGPDLSRHMMQNLSIGGCFIRTRTPEPAGSLVMIRFALPGEVHRQTVKAVGRVAWIRHDAQGPSGMGIQFVKVEQQDYSDIRTYITGRLD